ncbi:MAG: insulinase family protein [Capsulimonadaceae bacterium]
MSDLYGFELVREEDLPDLKSRGFLYRHIKTGAELLSVVNDDDNKVFAITFRTPLTNSNGVAHILEHSVLCGSRKYPLKEPFIELVKGSLNTFLNAMTGSAETYYPVASVNTKDFYNLVDVYLDSVFHPRLTPQTLQQEGWHYEVAGSATPIEYKGIVFNEMKGAYQSPDRVLYDYSERSLFPGHSYGVSSGGDPKKIPELTFERLEWFHQEYYHPSNARIWFWGDDDPTARLRLLDEYLSEFERRAVSSAVLPAEPFPAPRRLIHPFAVGDGDDTARAMMGIAWVLTGRIDFEFDLALEMLRHILTGTAASPLRKALIDSGLVDHVGGSVSELRQRAFTLGLKGIEMGDADEVEALVLSTLTDLADNGIHPNAVEAAVNTVEFALRELNTGGHPRGLTLAFYSLSTWLFDGDPFQPLRFEAPLASIKAAVAAGGYFESMIRDLFINNRHRATNVFVPDPGMAEREAQEERSRLDEVQAGLTPDALDALVEQTHALHLRQQTPDSEEALATLPRLTAADLDPRIKLTPTEVRAVPAGCTVHYHDLFTNGIVYVDLAFDLKAAPQDLIPYLPLFGRALTQVGTESEDFVSLTQRIGRKTGGVHHESLVTSANDTTEAVGRLVIRSKATRPQTPDLISILRDILITLRLDNPDRFRQMVAEERIRLESSVAAGGTGFVARRLGARFTEAGWASEQMAGVSYLNFIRELADRVQSDWPGVLSSFERLKSLLFTRSALTASVTLDAEGYADFEPQLSALAGTLPPGGAPTSVWTAAHDHTPEGLTVPGQVNFVGKAANLKAAGYVPSGTALVANNLLRTTWLWEKVRMEGGAYGGMCVFDHLSGVYSFLSYRDPNLLGTLANFDGAGAYLSRLSLSDAELTRNIIGTISDLDAYQLPDARGHSAFVRALVGETDERRQRRRDEVLNTTVADLRRFGDVLQAAMPTGDVCVVGPPDAIEKANAERPGWLRVTKVL